MIDFTYNPIIPADYKSRRERTSLRSLSLAFAFSAYDTVFIMSPRSFTKLLEKAVYNDYNRYCVIRREGWKWKKYQKLSTILPLMPADGIRYLKTAQDYTEYFHEALSFSDLYETYRYIEKHGLEKIATVIIRMI